MAHIAETETTFDNSFTSQFGFPKQGAATKVSGALQEKVRAFIEQSPFLVMATAAADGSCDASPKGGKPGWVKVLDDRRLIIPDVAGNKLFQSYLNMEENPQVGLIFFIPGVRDTARVNGRVEIVDRAAIDDLQVRMRVFEPDENAKILQGVIVHVEESYGHCPRALAFSRFWDGGGSASNGKRR